MGDFLHSFQAGHLLWLATLACASYIARVVGKKLAQHLVAGVTELNGNLKRLNATIHKVDIMWEKQADASMFLELERRERAAEAKS